MILLLIPAFKINPSEAEAKNLPAAATPSRGATRWPLPASAPVR